ncbi:FkbM family methyltransferase [Patescibacteria group bacterium]|nr:FkbM family methyltransferase [Patescibacteria group bacterium]
MRKKLLSIYKKINKVFLGTGIRRFKIIKAIDNFIARFLKSNFTIIQGQKMFLDSEDSLRLSLSGVYEPFETKIIKSVIKKDNTVIDIGANIGYYTLLFAKLVGRNGKIIAFEPDPDNFFLLKKNVEINGYKNATLIQKAVSNKIGTTKLYLHKNDKKQHSIYNSNNSRKSIEIESTRADNYINEKVDLIKIDIEGAEGETIKGMKNLLKKNKKIKIITEFSPCSLENSSVKSKEFLELLIGHNFKLYEINEPKKELKQTSPTKLLKAYTIRNRKGTNLLCVRQIMVK